MIQQISEAEIKIIKNVLITRKRLTLFVYFIGESDLLSSKEYKGLRKMLKGGNRKDE